MRKLVVNSIALLLFTYLTGCMHNYSDGSDYPLQLDISTTKKGDSIVFLISNKNKGLEEYYVKSFRVEKSRELCSEQKQLPPQLKWNFYSGYPLKGKFISASKGVFYKNGSNDIDKDTLYVVKAVISKVGVSRKGHGAGVFAVLSNGRLLTASTYLEIQKLCNCL
jgi:hypothetical protein